jgi:hypothetical protein
MGLPALIHAGKLSIEPRAVAAHVAGLILQNTCDPEAVVRILLEYAAFYAIPGEAIRIRRAIGELGKAS